MDIDLIRETLLLVREVLEAVEEEGATEFPVSVSNAIDEIDNALNSLDDE